MITGIKDKMLRYRKNIAERALIFGIRHNPEYFNAKVLEVSKLVTRKFIDNELNKQGLCHCHICNSREQLVKVDEVYLCKNHSQAIKKAVKNNG